MTSTFRRAGAVVAALVLGLPLLGQSAAAAEAIVVSPVVPHELNPPFRQNGTGGAPDATPDQAAAFAWQEFIALNWPATEQTGQLGDRDTPSATCSFSDPNCLGPTVWQTFRGKVETFPGRGTPPGYSKREVHGGFGYDAGPQYKYTNDVPACAAKQESEPTPWVNADETDQIALDNMYAGVVPDDASPGNSAPKLIRFLAKSNRTLYDYVAANSSPTDKAKQWWRAIPDPVVAATKQFLASKQASPPAGSKTMVSLPFGTIEIKAGWRPLSKAEAKSGRFHVRPVRFYENTKGGGFCFRNADWGLVALHIIQKTPSAPHFIYATFEQADNILTSKGKPVEDEQGRLLEPEPDGLPTQPHECLIDPRPGAGSPDSGASQLGSVVITENLKTCQPVQNPTYCDKPDARLYYRNFAGARPVPIGGNICVDKRDYAIPDFVVDANQQAHDAITKYLDAKGIPTSEWLYYKLINVQYHPYDHVIKQATVDGSRYKGKRPPFTADNPAVSTYYQANIVVETNRSLQEFSGSVTSLDPGAIQTNWNADGTQKKNMFYGGHFYNMGGCMGCHGAQGQNPPGQAGDFSVILAIGQVTAPEAPILDPQADRNWP